MLDDWIISYSFLGVGKKSGQIVQCDVTVCWGRIQISSLREKNVHTSNEMSEKAKEKKDYMALWWD